MKEYLVVLDTPSIKRFVFEASSLKDIRGASAILDGLNRGWLLDGTVAANSPGTSGGSRDFEDYLREQAKAQEERYRGLFTDQVGSRVKLKELVYANGGSGMLIVEADDPEHLEDMRNALARTYLYHTAGAATQLAAWQELDGKGFSDTVKQAFWKLHRQRGELAPAPPISNPWARFEDGLRARRGERLFRKAGESEEDRVAWVSEVTNRRRVQADRERQVWRELEIWAGVRLAPPASLEEVAKGSRSGNEIAVVYADGDAMGAHLKRLASTGDYRRFSAKIDRSVREAVFSAMKMLFVNRGLTSPMPADIILLGGDDVLVVLPPAQAPDFVDHVAREFQVHAGKDYSLSFGIAVGNSHCPFSLLVDQAEWCLRNAKKGTTGTNALRGAGRVDYHINRVGFYLDVGDYRSHEFVTESERARLSLRPLSIEDFRNHLRTARSWRDGGVAASRLYTIAEGLRRGPVPGHFAWVTGVGRAAQGRGHSDKAILAQSLDCWSGGNKDRISPWRVVAMPDGLPMMRACGYHDVLDLYEMTSDEMGAER